MPLDDTYPASVGFIIGWRTAPTGEAVRTPIGTGFVVSLPSPRPDRSYLYVATAAHVVRAENQTWVRFNTRDGGVRDLEVLQWFTHPTEDVAVVPFTPPDDLRWKRIPEAQFVDQAVKDNPEVQLNVGDPVYFIGLLAGLTHMAEANIPMVRSGTLGRLFQSKVPVRLPDDTVMRVTGHLIDCRSFRGFSGAPCFVQFQFFRHERDRVNHYELTPLLGLIAAHLDDWAKAKVTGDFFGEVQAPVNVGVGVVTPVEALRATLEMEELEEMREENEKRSKNQDDEVAATADSLASGDDQFTRQDFEAALRKATRKVTPIRPKRSRGQGKR